MSFSARRAGWLVFLGTQGRLYGFYEEMSTPLSVHIPYIYLLPHQRQHLPDIPGNPEIIPDIPETKVCTRTVPNTKWAAL